MKVRKENIAIGIFTVLMILGGCKSQGQLFRPKSEETSLMENLEGVWVAKTNENSPLNKFEFGKKGESITLKINDRPVQVLSFKVISQLNFSISFKGLDYTQMELMGSFQSFQKNSLSLINSDEVNQSYETLESVSLVRKN